MALGTLAATVLPAVASSATSFGLSRLAGSNRGGSTFTPPPLPSINAGGFTGTGGNINITPERAALTGNLAGQFTSEADRLAGLVGPGLENLRNVRLNRVNEAARRSIGNLRENLSRRRVLGSSFGQDALARAELAAGQERGQAEAQTFLEGIELLRRESDLRRSSVTTQLDDLNRAADIGLELSGRASTQFRENARIKAEIASREAAGSGLLAGRLSQPIARAVGEGVGDIFGGINFPDPSGGVGAGSIGQLPAIF